MAHYRDSGVIVRTHKLGEADRILSIITENNGKVRAVAKGVRKTRSRYGGRLELLRHLDLQFYQGRGDLDIVTQAQWRGEFPVVRKLILRRAGTTTFPLLYRGTGSGPGY